jgi:prepilin-type N-terminal cleavage/methylation domain-containing protein
MCRPALGELGAFMRFEMRYCAMQWKGRRSRAGFTLLELIMVLMVIAIGTSLSIDMIAGFDAHQRAERAARNCAAFARYARNLAMTTGKSAKLSVNPSTGTFAVYWESNGTTFDSTPVSQSLAGTGSMSITLGSRRDLAGTTMTASPSGTTDFVYTQLGSCSAAGTLTFSCAGVSNTVTIPAVGDPVVN